MNAAFLIISVISLVMMTIHSPESAFSSMINGVSGAISLSIKLVAIYAVWLSVLEMMNKTGIDKKLSKILKPLIKKIFKKESEEAYDWICINVSANMLGMGGVATPAGIKAMERMQDGSEKATHNMVMLFVINATSIQLIPATVIAMRASANSQNAADIILPTLISSGIATLLGIIICKVMSLKKDADAVLPCSIANNAKINEKGSLSTRIGNIKSALCKLKQKRNAPKSTIKSVDKSKKGRQKCNK